MGLLPQHATACTPDRIGRLALAKMLCSRSTSLVRKPETETHARACANMQSPPACEQTLTPTLGHGIHCDRAKHPQRDHNRNPTDREAGQVHAHPLLFYHTVRALMTKQHICAPCAQSRAQKAACACRERPQHQEDADAATRPSRNASRCGSLRARCSCCHDEEAEVSFEAASDSNSPGMVCNACTPHDTLAMSPNCWNGSMPKTTVSIS